MQKTMTSVQQSESPSPPEPSSEDLKRIVEGKALIYSGEHHAWWRPDSAGYTTDIRAAGVYDYETASSIAGGSGPDKKIEASRILSLESLLGPRAPGTVGELLARALTAATKRLEERERELAEADTAVMWARENAGFPIIVGHEQFMKAHNAARARLARQQEERR